MNTSIIFLILLGLGGIFNILSSYYEWTWWWRLGGVGDYIYNRFGHELECISPLTMKERGLVVRAFA